MDAPGPEAKVLLADRGYDSDKIRETLEARDIVLVIPTKRNRKVQTKIDDYIYALRNRIERCINKLKNSRRLATRYDKTAASYLAFVQIASIRLWTRVFVNRSYATQWLWTYNNDRPNMVLGGITPAKKLKIAA